MEMEKIYPLMFKSHSPITQLEDKSVVGPQVFSCALDR